MDIKENIDLSQYTTFKISCVADNFVEVSNIGEIIKALQWVKEKNLPYFILSGGSNVAPVTDSFNGLVIKIRPQSFDLDNSVIKKDDASVLLEVPTFVLLGDLVSKTISKGLKGLEWAAGIPGLVGGAIYGNAGAYGSDMSKSIVNVKSLNPETCEITERPNKDCDFSYRSSIFKNNREIIVSCVLVFSKSNPDELRLFVKNKIMERALKRPKLPSAGSVFKNIILDEQDEDFKKMIPADVVKGGKVPMGYLIDQCGLKGFQCGGAKVSDEHGNVIVNCDNAKAGDLKAVIGKIKEEIKDKFGIIIDEEIVYIR